MTCPKVFQLSSIAPHLFIIVLSLAGLSAMAQAEERPLANITTTGDITVAVEGGASGTCRVTLLGTSDAGGMTLSSYEGAKLDGNIDCSDADAVFTLPLRLVAVSRTHLNIKRLAVAAQGGRCEAENVQAPWDFDTYDVNLTGVMAGQCTFAGILKFKVEPINLRDSLN